MLLQALLDYERHKAHGGELSVPIASHSEPMTIENQVGTYLSLNVPVSVMLRIRTLTNLIELHKDIFGQFLSGICLRNRITSS